MKIIIPTLLTVMFFSQFDFKEKTTEKPAFSLVMTQDTPKVDANKSSDVVKQAVFEGGEIEYVKFLTQNLKYPKKALRNNIQGTVYIKFVIDTDGIILQDCVKVVKEIHPALGEEAIRVVRLSPKWIPAEVGKRKIKSRMTIPIVFKIAERKKKRKKE